MIKRLSNKGLALLLPILCWLPSAQADNQTLTTINASSVLKQCHKNGWDKASLLELKERNFTVEDQTKKQQHALQLLDCLASPDKEIRDDIAFTALSQWLRADSFSNELHLTMFDKLIHALQSNVDDKYGVYQPFVALVLSEVVRVDRKSTYLNDKQRTHAVNVVSKYFTEIRDYRGFEDDIGWRHAVAHTADIMLQLALNPNMTKAHLNTMLDALSSQVSANRKHYYVHGEPKRIAMAVAYNFLTGKHTEAEWSKWLESVSNPAPLEAWNDSYKSEAALTKLHNTQAFLYSFYSLIKASKNETLVMMVPALEAAIQKVK